MCVCVFAVLLTWCFLLLVLLVLLGDKRHMLSLPWCLVAGVVPLACMYARVCT